MTKLMQRFQQLPLTIYRIQSQMPVNLREFGAQMKIGRTSYDLKLQNGLVVPTPKGSPYQGPNGMIFRPLGPRLISSVESWRGSPTVFRMHAGMHLPSQLVLLEEHPDCYSPQTSEPVSLTEFNKRLTEFLERGAGATLQGFMDMVNDPDDFDN